MTGSQHPHRRSAAQVAVRVAMAIVATVTGVIFLLLALMVIRSRFGPPEADPHGYALIFGTLLAVAVGLVTFATVPFVFPREKRFTAFRVSLVVYVAASAALIIMWFTAT